MGAGITLAALYAGIPTSIYDISDEMLVQAEEYIQRHLDRKGKLQNLDLLKHTNKLEDLSKANIIIEAVPEKLALKQELFEKLDQITPKTTTLATNTSTLAVTAIAASAENPERVAGMHFFNPAPVLPLVELVRAARTSQNTLQILTQLAERLGKTPVVVSDTPGFIVNRVARPFYGEALRLLTEGAANHEQIDQIARLGAGFRMGPFELMDLIGIDVNLAAMRSMYEQTFGEPRYRPQQIQVQKVQQGALGKKTGRGFYRYDQQRTIKDPPIPTIRKNSGTVLTGSGTWAPGLTALGRSAGYRMANGDYASPGKVSLAIATAGMDEDLYRQVSEFDQSLAPNIPIICQCADVTLTEVATWLKNPERLVGFDGLFLASGKVATL
ncbi:MAG: 3-hydroxyacyl-CoA dehydrogenase NAD-binding domain-containing protein, partial [Anaerolineales bacterium]